MIQNPAVPSVLKRSCLSVCRSPYILRLHGEVTQDEFAEGMRAKLGATLGSSLSGEVRDRHVQQPC